MPSREEELYQERVAKVQRLRERGIDPYPARYDRTHTSAQAIEAFEVWEAKSEGDAPSVSVAGRVTALRTMGKVSFLDLRDGDGRIQIMVRSNVVSPNDLEVLKESDLGDILGAQGKLFRTRTGEITVEATGLAMLAKALQAPPEKWHGLQDVELRYRQRYRDLMSNEEVRDIFKKRAAIVSSIRRYLDDRGFMEVETPVLQNEAGGAAATPFITHHRALDQDFYMRISLELHLKRLLVGGFDKVYEIGRIFRNEGVSWKYNPEFTMLECYEAYADYNSVMAMVEDMVSSIAVRVLGDTKTRFEGHEIDLAPPWRRVTMRDALIEEAGIDFTEYNTRETLYGELQRRGLPDLDPGWSWGKLIDEAVSHYVEPKLIQPTFLTDYPKEISPLAKSKPGEDGIVERFEFFIAGFEMGNAYSELNDPLDQRERFETQRKLAAAGVEEVETLDEDFLYAIEHGMPPTGGLGIGIDRLTMILTGQKSIREVILFPALRRQS
ncbi:MAG TPA: lysine--tRNA ligase [Dehalococcoidia bacterium]|jgi:lysyl-tRNA synthetase class 2|nr:lysine--tRNA ligase [Dehalococcoidia bacterium]